MSSTATVPQRPRNQVALTPTAVVTWWEGVAGCRQASRSKPSPFKIQTLNSEVHGGLLCCQILYCEAKNLFARFCIFI